MITAVAAELADAIRTQAVQAGADSPHVRGSDWRMATVQTVGADGTITTTDGVIARRLETYSQPTVGDVVVITGSGVGSWLCWGRMGADAATGAWVSYTPSWTASTTNPTLGNGTVVGRYALAGKVCHVTIRLIPGSTTTFGTGTYLFGVPFTAASANVEYMGVARLTAGSTFIGQVDLGAGGALMNATFPSQSNPGIAANMSTVAPATFASGHTLRMSLTYEIA